MSSQPSGSVADAIAHFSVHFDAGVQFPALASATGRALIDTVAVAIGGGMEPASQHIWTYGRSVSGGSAPATAWGCSLPLGLEQAVLYNGVAGHVLDYDDVNSPLRGHPSIALLPPLVALAQSRGKSGRELVNAYAVGFEVLVRLARCMVDDHYARGWHATTTLGCIAAAAACAHVLGLNHKQTVNAIGLAVAQASGTRENFGYMAKSLQAGQCGVSALRSVLFAELGLDASGVALEGKQGFSKLYGNGETLSELVENLGNAPLELLYSGIEIKKYPMCYAAHRAIDGMLDLRKEYGLMADSVNSILVESNHRAMVPLIHARPQTGLEGKFSMQYAMAAALLDGTVRLSSFTDEVVQRPSAQTLLNKVQCRENTGPTTPRWNRLTVHLSDGRVLCKEIHHLRGSHELPLTQAQLWDKWTDCLGFAGVQDDGKAFFSQAMQLGEPSVQALMALLPLAPWGDG